MHKQSCMSQWPMYLFAHTNTHTTSRLALIQPYPIHFVPSTHFAHDNKIRRVWCFHCCARLKHKHHHQVERRPESARSTRSSRPAPPFSASCGDAKANIFEFGSDVSECVTPCLHSRFSPHTLLSSAFVRSALLCC